MNAAIHKAAEVLKSQANLARALGVKPPTVNEWIKERRPVPRDFGPAIERLTDGRVTRKDIFPNQWMRWWPELAANESQPKESNHE